MKNKKWPRSHGSVHANTSESADCPGDRICLQAGTSSGTSHHINDHFPIVTNEGNFQDLLFIMESFSSLISLTAFKLLFGTWLLSATIKQPNGANNLRKPFLLPVEND